MLTVRLQRRKRPLVRPHMPLEGGAQGAIEYFRHKRDEEEMMEKVMPLKLLP